MKISRSTDPIDAPISPPISERLDELINLISDISRHMDRQATQSVLSVDHCMQQRAVRQARPALPDPRLIRRVIRQRQLRARFFGGDLFADPAWDMLLDLTAARVEHTRVSVTSLCIASGVPSTTALRWIAVMTEAGLFQRVGDDVDRRRRFIALTDDAVDAMARYFAELGRSALSVV